MWLPGYIGAGIVWGLSFLFISVCLATLTPFGVASLRVVLGAVALLIWCVVTNTKLPRSPRIWALSLVFSIFVNVIPFSMFSYAETFISSALAGVLNATTPMMALVMTYLFFREQRVTANQLVGVLSGFAGIVILSGILFEPQQNTLLGILLVLVATSCYGIGYPFARRFLTSTGYSATSLAATQVSSGAGLLALFMPFVPLVHGEWTLDTIVSMLLLGMFGTGFVYIWNFRIIAFAGSAVASTVTYITPVVAVIAGVVLIHDVLHWYQFVGGAVVIVSAALVQERIRLVRRVRLP